MRISTYLAALLVAFPLLLMPACGGICTEVGCASGGLTLVARYPASYDAAPFTVVVTTPGGVEATFSCDRSVGLECGPSTTPGLWVMAIEGEAAVRVDFEGAGPESTPSVTLRIENAMAEVVSGTLALTYEKDYPNGEDSPPPCYSVPGQPELVLEADGG